MTSKTWKENSGVQIVAGGREVWAHNPDTCEIELVSVTDNRLILKASAGGYDRGIAIEWRLCADFLLERYAEIVGITGPDPEVLVNLISHLLERYKSMLQAKTALVPLVGCGLTTRTAKLLVAGGLRNLGQLAELAPWELLRIPGIGDASLREVEEVLAEFGFRLSR